MSKLFHALSKVSLIWYNIIAFVLGAVGGIAVKIVFGEDKALFDDIVAFISPLGTVLVAMLKTVVIPIIFFSLVSGASSLPLKKFGKLGSKVIIFYMATSLFATIFGVIVATLFSPTMNCDASAMSPLLAQVDGIKVLLRLMVMSL